MNASSVTKTRGQALLGSFGLWLSWVLASTFGYWISFMLAFFLFQLADVAYLDSLDDLWMILFLLVPANVILGLVPGGLQFLVLRRRLERPLTWIIWTALAWIFVGLVPFISVFHLDLVVLPGLVTGTIVGTCQWMVLRRTVKSAVWWITVSAFGWVLGMFATFRLNLVLGGGILIGVVTGLALVVLLDRSDYGALASRSWR